MASSRNSRRRRSVSIPLLILILIIIAAFLVVLVLDLSGVIHVFGKDEPRQPYTVSGGTVELHMINVGQGDSILIMAPEGNILFDAGDTSNSAKDAITTYLNDLGITELDYLIFTHPDADHIGAGKTVVDTYSVDTVLMEPYTYSGNPSKTYSTLVQTIEDKNIPVIDPAPGETYSVGELHMKVLGPTDTFKDTNSNSIVMRLDFGETSFMMTGDATDEEEAGILAAFPAAELDCDLLKVGHHGSDTSTSQAFLDAVSPQFALISCGINNKYNHPLPVIVQRLVSANAIIYRTDQNGSVAFVSDGKTLQPKLPANSTVIASFNILYLQPALLPHREYCLSDSIKG